MKNRILIALVSILLVVSVFLSFVGYKESKKNANNTSNVSNNTVIENDEIDIEEQNNLYLSKYIESEEYYNYCNAIAVDKDVKPNVTTNKNDYLLITEYYCAGDSCDNSEQYELEGAHSGSDSNWLDYALIKDNSVIVKYTREGKLLSKEIVNENKPISIIINFDSSFGHYLYILYDNGDLYRYFYGEYGEDFMDFEKELVYKNVSSFWAGGGAITKTSSETDLHSVRVISNGEEYEQAGLALYKEKPKFEKIKNVDYIISNLSNDYPLYLSKGNKKFDYCSYNDNKIVSKYVFTGYTDIDKKYNEHLEDDLLFMLSNDDYLYVYPNIKYNKKVDKIEIDDNDNMKIYFENEEKQLNIRHIDLVYQSK